MTETDPIPSTEELFGKHSEVLTELKEKCAELRELISKEYPPALIGFCWSMMLLSLMSKSGDEENSELPPVSADENQIIMAMEYVHAVWASCENPELEFRQVDEADGARIIELASDIQMHALRYAMSRSLAEDRVAEHPLGDLGYAIRSSWALLRGRRFPVMEKEFFEFVLAPHSDILKEVYDVTPEAIAQGIQDIANCSRTGIADTAEKMRTFQLKHEAAAANAGMDLHDYMEAQSDENPEELGIYRQTALPKLLEGRLKNCTILNDVYYPLPDGNWAECDCIIICDDILLVIEAKAGTESLLSVSENLDKHISAVVRRHIKLDT